MIARELTEFFAGFSPDGAPAIQRAADDGSLAPGVPVERERRLPAQRPARRSASATCAYAEDQAFARDLFAAGRLKAYHPGAAVLHAHDYPWSEFMRRYFDEYRGLRETTGHVEQIGVRSTARDGARRRSRATARSSRRRASAGAERARLDRRARPPTTAGGASSPRSARAPTGCPPARARALSLEGRGDAATAPPRRGPADVPSTSHRAARA